MEKFKLALIAMFGSIWTQPIHVTLRNFRLVHIWLIYQSMAILKDIVDNLKTLNDPMQVAMAYGAIAAALITAIWASMSYLHKSNSKDE